MVHYRRAARRGEPGHFPCHSRVFTNPSGHLGPQFRGEPLGPGSCSGGSSPIISPVLAMSPPSPASRSRPSLVVLCWGVLGVVALLGQAVWRMVPLALEP